MEKILFINCCIREKNSRTLELAEFFLHTLKEMEKSFELIERKLMDLELKPLVGEFFNERERLLREGNLEHERFFDAHEFAVVDKIVIAAPFWDLSIPALLKIYIENICVEGITFACDESGMHGLCKADHMLFITTRGDFYGEGPLEMGVRYLEALCQMFGVEKFDYIDAEGLDVVQKEKENIMNDAKEKLKIFAETFV